MFHQNDTRTRLLIEKYGCYYFSIADEAYHQTNFPVSIEFLNEEMYLHLQKMGYMTETCFVQDPVAIFREFGVPVRDVRKRPASYHPMPGEIVIGQWKADGDISHFVRMNTKGWVVGDPWFSPEGGSRAVREGQLISYRIFRL